MSKETNLSVVEIQGVRCYVDKFGAAWINAEDAVRGLGFVDVQEKFSATSGRKSYEVIRWARVNDYLRKYGYYAMPGHNEYFELNKVTSEKFLKVVKAINNYNRACYDLNAKKKRMYELSKEWLEVDKECKALETKKQELIEKVDESMQEFFEMGKMLKVEDRDLVEAIASKEELS